MSGAVFVGVDSGGTRTNVAIVAEGDDGTRSATYESESSLSGGLAPELITKTLMEILAPLRIRLEDLSAESLPMYVWIGAAGFSPWTRDDFILAMEEVPPHIGGDTVDTMGCGNDAVSVLLGSRTDGIVIAGTGSSVIVRARTGVLHQAGGHEWVASDYGSGFWIGLNAIRAAYKDYSAGNDSVLLQRLRQVYGIRREDNRGLIAKLRDLGVADSNLKKEIARFAASVCDAAERGDPDSQNVVKVNAEELADVTAGALRRQFTTSELAEGVSLVEVGGLLSNELYRASFEAQLDLRLRSGIEERAVISWRRATTASAECIRLARDLKEGKTEFLRLDLSFRPSVVRP